MAPHGGGECHRTSFGHSLSIRKYGMFFFSSWLCENVPYYYAKACEFVGPYLQLVWEKMYDAGVYIAESTKPQRDWLALKITELFDWVGGDFITCKIYFSSMFKIV